MNLDLMVVVVAFIGLFRLAFTVFALHRHYQWAKGNRRPIQHPREKFVPPNRRSSTVLFLDTTKASPVLTFMVGGSNV